jgi:hypothetical protein
MGCSGFARCYCCFAVKVLSLNDRRRRCFSELGGGYGRAVMSLPRYRLPIDFLSIPSVNALGITPYIAYGYRLHSASRVQKRPSQVIHWPSAVHAPSSLRGKRRQNTRGERHVANKWSSSCCTTRTARSYRCDDRLPIPQIYSSAWQ